MSLRARILWLVLVASMLPVLAMVWVLLQNRASSLAQMREQLLLHTGVIAADLEDKVSGTAQLLFGLARVPVLAGGDGAACSVFLAEVLREHPQYTGLLTILPNGQLHCDSLRSGRKLDLNDRDYFRRASRSTRHVVEPVVGRLTGKSVLQIAYPVRRASGELEFILLASLDLDAYGRSTVAKLPFPKANLQIWNDGGTAIMDFPAAGATALAVSPQQRQSLNGFATERTTAALQEGDPPRIWAGAPLPRSREPGLQVVLSLPQAALHEGADASFRQALIGVGLLSVLVFVGAAALGEFAIRRQTMRLMGAISRVDAGRFDAPVGAPYPRGELGDVMAALDRMARSLVQQREVIDRNTEALEQQASHDALTGLANRYLLADRLDQSIIFSRRSQRLTGVLLLDLDRFKTVNDSLGHSQGDQLLVEVARRLSQCVRQGDTVARLGGDEFVLVLSDMAEVTDIAPMVQRILGTLSQPILVGGQALTVATSVGISVCPRDGEDADQLLQHADTAMYRAKASGGNGMAFFTPAMNQETLARLHTEAGLRRALEQGELRVHYQSIVDAASGRIVAAEALLRWQDPERGLVLPGQFIAIAEESGLICDIGQWVLREACAQIRAWQEQGLGDLAVSVNLSARQFTDPALDTLVAQTLASTGCPASLLQLEITESMVMEQPERALQTMQQLERMGVKLLIDDFGTGYSSLAYLRRFPISKLKIDRSFVQDIDSNANDEAIVNAIVVLARKLGMRTVAEGVETWAQAQALVEQGCDELQGYLFDRPSEPVAFSRLLRREPAPEAGPARLAAGVPFVA